MELFWIQFSAWSPPQRWPPLRLQIMELEPNKYYHVYNRSNNHELLFRNRGNYIYFLEKYRKNISPFVNTIAYCLMPDHFHFSVYVKSKDSILIKKSIGLLLSSYTKAINKSYSRVGSLFQQHTKTKLIEDENNLLTVIAYIHQNPLRKNLVSLIEEWQFSSYRDYVGLRDGSLIDKTFIENRFSSIEAFKLFSLSKVEKNNFIYDLH
ncbi:MAG TPA: transposase [Ignavibacteriales bacterium]|nr:transposase [Ignavibacteriales bacterium]